MMAPFTSLLVIITYFVAFYYCFASSILNREKAKIYKAGNNKVLGKVLKREKQVVYVLFFGFGKSERME